MLCCAVITEPVVSVVIIPFVSSMSSMSFVSFVSFGEESVVVLLFYDLADS